MSDLLKVMVVDDSIVYRRILSDIVERIPEAQLLCTAQNGKIALNKAETEDVDVILMDIEMPVMNGLDSMKKIKEIKPYIEVVMVSSMNRYNANITVEALEAGALDFVAKPDQKDEKKNVEELLSLISPLFKHIETRRHLKMSGRLEKKPIFKPKPEAPEKEMNLDYPPAPSRFDIVVIGVSTGGPQALMELIPQLPKEIGVPILIVQHMPPIFTASLAESLDKKSKLKVKEAIDGEPVLPNVVYIAPGGKHMEVFKKGTNKGYSNLNIITNENPPEHSCRPAVDVLFRSVADISDGNVLCLIMTGMGQDGAKGVQELKKKSAYCISQSKDTCVVYSMPRAVDELGISNEKTDLKDIAFRVVTLLSKSRNINW